MMSFQWGKRFITGLPDVDEQHYQLIIMINKFGTLLSENAIHIDDIDSLYQQLADYATYHFHEEEELMVRAKIDKRHLGAHIEMHKRFLHDVKSIYASVSVENISEAQSFLKFLIHWLAFHILGEDMEMAKQMKAIQAGGCPADAYEQLKQDVDHATAPLIDALNNLFELVSVRNKELKQLNDQLESKVKLRTNELLESNHRLEELALTDALTGLPNRRSAMQSLSILWEQSIDSGEPLVCMMIDADHFKPINDTYGHDAGDTVLCELAKTLRYAFRNDDAVCRLGGDEFFVVCPNTSLSDGVNLGESIRRKVENMQVITGSSYWQGSVSIGVACRQESMSGYEVLIKTSDDAVYEAKKFGKNCVKTADSLY